MNDAEAGRGTVATPVARRRLAKLALAQAALPTLLRAAPAAAQITGDALRIGLLTDMAGANADLSGPGTLEAMAMAIEDYGGTILGRPIQILVGDHANKPDVGLSIARNWYDSGVVAIFDVGLSSIALGVQALARQQNKIVIFGSSLTSDLTGSACSPNGISWVTDNYAQAKAVVTEAVSEGSDTWFFITADYVLGRNIERDATTFINAQGGTVVGSVVHPLDLTDAAAFLLAAKASGAKAIGLATTTANASAIIKQAHEFRFESNGQRLFAFNLQERDILSIGLDVAQGYLTTAPFYWDLTDATRNWSKRFYARRKVMPNSIHAGMYGAALHYLKAVASVGRDARSG
jgi:branched-chain amino acid transport system substrate-binding protein